MAPVTVSLVSLMSSTPLSAFLAAIKESQIRPILLCRVVQWIINPTIAEHLLYHHWDYVLVLPQEIAIPDTVSQLLEHTFSIRIHQNDEMLSFTLSNNEKLLHPESIDPTFNLSKPLIANSAQKVELTPALLAFAQSPLCPAGPVSMLNFMALYPFRSAAENYAKYIQAFKTSVGSKRGGVLKIYGDTQEMGIWNKVALAQYPTLAHFTDMAADPEYQKLNYNYRLPSLRDTCILMTTEVHLEWAVNGASL
jgi:uncharacterized protein (DUF1330 family)